MADWSHGSQDVMDAAGTRTRTPHHVVPPAFTSNASLIETLLRSRRSVIGPSSNPSATPRSRRTPGPSAHVQDVLPLDRLSRPGRLYVDAHQAGLRIPLSQPVHSRMVARAAAPTASTHDSLSDENHQVHCRPAPVSGARAYLQRSFHRRPPRQRAALVHDAVPRAQPHAEHVLLRTAARRPRVPAKKHRRRHQPGDLHAADAVVAPRWPVRAP